MTHDLLTPLQKMALVLDAPIIITGTIKNYTDLKPSGIEESLNMLSSWWDIHSKSELEETLQWLDQEGGHTVVYHKVLDELLPLTHVQQQARVERAKKQDHKEGIRFKTALQYLYDLSPATIYAFDVARYVNLAKTGYSLDWFSEQELWSMLEEKARSITEKPVFATHEDYLLSFAVGRTFSMGHDSGTIKQTNENIKTLITSPESPFVSYINWSTIVQEAQIKEGVE
ncbi:DUF1266 domain-containing protein [Reinekea sp. G2M2-21]|uniref:DUF1266 domain-containing protein n=1 Tax=Reinekea sp. G2M2-21 TaxID=2788942 RepID=UPI0018AA42ED|nr:DUF1266 domain-containing protein [Reinekea sp. G2M2-21]